MKFSYILITALGALMFTACTSPVDGTWESTCVQSDNTLAKSKRVQKDFFFGQQNIYTSYFDDADCRSELFRVEQYASFTLSASKKKLEDNNEVYEIDTYMDATTTPLIVALSDVGADILNQNAYCDITDWIRGEAILVRTGFNCISEDFDKDQFDIIYVDRAVEPTFVITETPGDHAYFGAGSNYSKSNRPTELNTSNKYIPSL